MNKHLPNKKKSVLIVDDDKDDQFFLLRALQEVKPDSEVRAFNNGCELLQYFKAAPELPGLIFMDLNMQKMDGRSTLIEMKKDLALAVIPVIILTTSASLTERLELTELGAADFYTKPVCSKQLVDIVDKVTRRWLG